MNEKIIHLHEPAKLNTEVTINGWVRTVRNQKSFAFIEVNDGTTLIGIQVVADAKLPNFNQIISRSCHGFIRFYYRNFGREPREKSTY